VLYVYGTNPLIYCSPLVTKDALKIKDGCGDMEYIDNALKGSNTVVISLYNM